MAASTTKPKPSADQSKSRSNANYDLDTFTCGDLGFGFGLKPGGIPMRKFNPDTLAYEDDLPQDSLMMHNLFLLSDEDVPGQQTLTKMRSYSTPCLTSRNRRIQEAYADEDGGLRWRNIPVLDGVPMGTSMRQQRELYEAKIKEYLERKGTFSTTSAMNGQDGQCKLQTLNDINNI